MINPYEFLGLTNSECSLSDLKTAYYRLALICHPDKGGDPGAMMTLTLAYQWILDQLLAANQHQKEFEEYYGEALKNGEALQNGEALKNGDGDAQTTPPTIPSFTDVLAETFEYTPERFKAYCENYAITAPEIQQMLFIPAFEWAMAKKATPETLNGHIHTFLENYLRDTQTPLDSVEYYVPMSDPTGYGTLLKKEDADFETTTPTYHRHVASNMVLYTEPVCRDTPVNALLQVADASAFGFTNTAAPLPLYDYEEAFTTYYLPGNDAIDPTPFPLQEALETKALERSLQDQHISSMPPATVSLIYKAAPSGGAPAVLFDSPHNK